MLDEAAAGRNHPASSVPTKPLRAHCLVPEPAATQLLDEARRHDPDRYLCALLAPPARRDALLTLILFNHELARIPEIVSQPVAGMIRLQWWREALDELTAGQPPRRHPVVEALAAVLAAAQASPADLHRLIDARVPALEGLAPDAPALEGHAAATSGALQAISYDALGGASAAEREAAAAIGTAFGLARLANAVRGEALRRAVPGLDEAANSVRADLQRRAAELLRLGRRQAGRPARAQMAAFLPAALTATYLRREERIRPATMPLVLLLRAFVRRP